MTGKPRTDGALYDRIGHQYSGARYTEPRIARRIWAALGDARTVVNVGAGTGSYEPPDRKVTAVEPSTVMRAQRSADAAPCIAASAEALPFADQSFDAAMAILSDHHWSDPIAGLREMQRVARRVVVFQWDSHLPARSGWCATTCPSSQRSPERTRPSASAPKRLARECKPCRSPGTAPTGSFTPTGGARRPTCKSGCDAAHRSGPASAGRPSNERSPPWQRISDPAHGIRETRSFSIFRKQIWALACSSPADPTKTEIIPHPA